MTERVFSENEDINAEFRRLTEGMSDEEAIDFAFSNDPRAKDLLIKAVRARHDLWVAVQREEWQRRQN